MVVPWRAASRIPSTCLAAVPTLCPLTCLEGHGSLWILKDSLGRHEECEFLPEPSAAAPCSNHVAPSLGEPPGSSEPVPTSTQRLEFLWHSEKNVTWHRPRCQGCCCRRLTAGRRGIRLGLRSHQCFTLCCLDWNDLVPVSLCCCLKAALLFWGISGCLDNSH